jgi:hypothetical protein
VIGWRCLRFIDCIDAISAGPREHRSHGSAFSVAALVIQRGASMLAVPSAILVFAMGYLTSPVAGSLPSWGASIAPDAIVAACSPDSLDSTPAVVSLPGTFAFSRMMRRTGRLKATVEESDDEFEEADLGPTYLPKGHNPPRSIHVASRPIPMSCRLRC